MEHLKAGDRLEDFLDNYPTVSRDQAVELLKHAATMLVSGYSAHMREITCKEAKNRFGQLLRSAQRGPVRITRNGTPVGVMLSVEQFEGLLGTAWDRLAAAMDAMRREAADNDLTPAALESLLSDEG